MGSGCVFWIKLLVSIGNLLEILITEWLKIIRHFHEICSQRLFENYLKNEWINLFIRVKPFWVLMVEQLIYQTTSKFSLTHSNGSSLNPEYYFNLFDVFVRFNWKSHSLDTLRNRIHKLCIMNLCRVSVKLLFRKLICRIAIQCGPRNLINDGQCWITDGG